MTQVLIDGITTVNFTNGVMRIECAMAGPNNQAIPSGTLLIAAPQVGVVLQTLINASQEINKKIQEQQQAAAGAAPSNGNSPS